MNSAMFSKACISMCPITVPLMGGEWLCAQRMRFTHRDTDAAGGV